VSEKELIERNDDILPEYHFDYGKAHPNRFAEGNDELRPEYNLSQLREGAKGKYANVLKKERTWHY
jgi:hypothetical protein